MLKARLLFWRLRYRLSRLTLDGGGSIVAVVNPQAVVDTTNPADVGRALLPILMKVERQVMATNRRQRKNVVAQAQQKVDDGEESRMTALGEIFLALRAALEAKDPNLLADPGSPLVEVAQAFDSWLQANTSGEDGKVSTKELRRAKMVLVTKLRIFMRSRRGV